MTDDSARETETCTILQGPDGALYCLSEKNLRAHRLPQDVAAAVRKVYGKGGIPAPEPRAGQYQILGQGPFVRRVNQQVTTADGWFDQYA